MIRALFRKQMMELFSFFWQDRKKNKKRTGVKLALFALLYLALFGMIVWMFYEVAGLICRPLAEAGLGWLYFSLISVLGVALGAFGSIFSTYASLYLAKDNALLLAMPVPPSAILAVRLFGVYMMGLVYELLVMAPATVQYFLTVKPSIGAAACAVVLTLALSLVILVLSTVLGWCVAVIASRTRHKSMITVALSLAFIAAYYYLYSRAALLLQDLLLRLGAAGDFVKKISPLYRLGLAGEGDVESLLWVAGTAAALAALVYLALAKSYRRILTTDRGEARVKYREKKTAARSVGRALFGKELSRFLSSSVYMLNCGLGIVFMLVMAAFLLLKLDLVKSMLAFVPAEGSGVVSLLVLAVICAAVTMCDITAPSISLEGKNLWILQSFPVSGRQALLAKLKLHLVLTLVPAAVLTACAQWALRPDPLFALLIPAVVFLFVCLTALFGLAMNLKMPNLTWTSEVIPVKQSLCTMISLMGGGAAIAVLAGLYYLLRNLAAPEGYLIAVTAALLIGDAALFRWVTTRGARIFESL